MSDGSQHDAASPSDVKSERATLRRALGPNMAIALVVGNVIGSNLFNLLSVLGLTSIVSFDISDPAGYDAQTIVANFDELSEVRQRVLVDMAFNLGRKRLLKFRLTRAAIERRDWARAADEMVDSHWFMQVGPRAARLVAMMRTGDDYQD